MTLPYPASSFPQQWGNLVTFDLKLFFHTGLRMDNTQELYDIRGRHMHRYTQNADNIDFPSELKWQQFYSQWQWGDSVMMFSEKSTKFILWPIISDQGTSQSPVTVCGNIMSQRQCVLLMKLGLVAHTELKDLSRPVSTDPVRRCWNFVTSHAARTHLSKQVQTRAIKQLPNTFKTTSSSSSSKQDGHNRNDRSE